jgi:hypothetical protein
VPLDYGTGWALSADGLLGAGQNGLSIIRMAGLAWSRPNRVARYPCCSRRDRSLCRRRHRRRRRSAVADRDGRFGESVRFEQPVTVSDATKAEILIWFPSSLGPHVTPVAAPRNGASTLRHSIVLADGHVYPGTPLTARWRLTFADGSSETGPEVSVTYADDRFDWQTAESEHVRIFWYEGSAAFGRRALRIGEDAIADAEELLGVDVTEPVDFFVYPDEAPFYDAIGPGARENVGGTFIPGLEVLFALITPGEIDDAWVRIVVPHELTHLVFDTAVDNPYHFPPRWLNEGLATLSRRIRLADRRLVDGRRRWGVIPLDGLVGQFPTTPDGFALAYAESVSAIDYMIRTHGQDALVELIRSYADARTDAEAFSDALGVDAAAFDEAWFADLGAQVPDRIGPRPDPAGPLPPGWSGSGATPGPGSSGEPAPTATPAPGADGGGDGDAAVIAVVGLSAAVIAVVGLAAWLLVRRRRAALRGSAAADAAADAPMAATEPDGDASQGQDP